MKKTSVAAGLSSAFLISAFMPIAAAAQTAWMPGTEITGHAVRVDSGGVVNTVYFDPGGSARIVSAAGREVPGRWSTENQMLCLEAGGNRECWPYAAAFQAGQPVSLTSTCQTTSSWTALSTEPMGGPPPVERRRGERGK